MTLRVLALAALLFGALPAGTGQIGTPPSSSGPAGSAASARVGTGGGRYVVVPAERGRPGLPAGSVVRAATAGLALLGSPTGTVPVRAPAAALAASTATPSPVTAGLVLAAAPLTADLPALDTMNGVHGPYSLTSDQCGTCHRSHDAANTKLLSVGGPQSTLCFSCHNGTGASRNVQAQFNDATIPANDPASRTYYGHDATIVTSHTEARVDEFGGVLNRHSECGDCHNAHRVTPAAQSVAQTGGWAVSGALNGMSGVQVTNGAAGTAPTYAFLNGEDAPVALEYQLCLKCHSGFTTLPSNDSFTPSRYFLDKGVEFNPANPSFHPVEAAGTNQTAAMAASLAGPSPYKLWNFTVDSTIRCVSCHASSAIYDATQPVSAGGDLPAHRSAYPGILLRNYRDRMLKSATEGYDAADFALCYLCHAEEPFVSETSTATNFRLHAMHLTDMAGEGAGGTDIDTAGAGQGDALCAECHFRLHSTSFPAGVQTLSGSRLVNFAPNVTPYNGELSFTGGTCTLVCHGQAHDRYQY